MPSQNMLIIGGALAIGAIVILSMRDGAGGFTRFVATPPDSELTPPTNFVFNRGEEEQVGP